MQESTTPPTPLMRLQALSTGQKLTAVAVLVVIFLLILGALNQTGNSNQLQVGLQTQPYFVLAILSFVGGLLSFASPCTLPVLTAYFAFAFQNSRTQIATNTLAFTLGLATTFTLFGAVGFALGWVLGQNQALMLIIGGSVIMTMGILSLLGKGFGGVDNSNQQTQNNGIVGSYLFGLSFAVGWTSCIGPILGTVITLAYYTDTVWRGMSLLFIYTLGLGLPLIIVSTLFGRLSRKSLFWRILRGKGWQWNTHLMVVALLWGLAIWRILTAVVEYLFRTYPVFEGRTFTSFHEFALLGLVVLGAVLWTVTSPEEKRLTLNLHSTQLVSGILFILIAVLMLSGSMTFLNGLLADAQFAQWLIEFEDKLVSLFAR